MEGRTHQFAIPRACAPDVGIHRSGNRVMLEQIAVGRSANGTKMRDLWRVWRRTIAGKFGAAAIPGFDLVLEGENRIVLLVSSPMNRKSFIRLPASNRPLAAIQEGRDLLPGFQTLLRRVSQQR